MPDEFKQVKKILTQDYHVKFSIISLLLFLEVVSTLFQNEIKPTLTSLNKNFLNLTTPKGPYKRAYIAAHQCLLPRCHNPRAAIHKVECNSILCIAARALRQPNLKVALPQCTSSNARDGMSCITAAAMHDLRLPQLAGVGRF